MAIKKSKSIKYQNHSRHLSKVLLVLMLLSISSILMGCQVSEKNKWLATYKDEMKIRVTNVEAYLLNYLEKKYHEEFISHGLIGGTWTWDMPAKSQAMLEFHMESVGTGIEFKPAYSGAYIHAESNESIENYRWIDDADYWDKKRDHDFTIRENTTLERYFPGYKTHINMSFGLGENEYDDSEFDHYRNALVLNQEELNVEYLINMKKNELNSYFLYMDYFRDVNEINKEDMLKDVYDFILYTRDLGFKRCNLHFNIFDESIRDSAEYKEYLANDEEISLGMYLGLAGKKTVTIIVDTSEMENINSVEDLEKYHVMNITKEKVDK